jgi:hypothetical protein
MSDYSNWKILKTELDEKQEEYSEVAEWCNESGEYHIEEVGEYYMVVKNPEPLPPTYEEVDRMRVQYRKDHIDDKTIARMRKTANGTWTEEDEQAYLALDAEVTAYIESHFPYPSE